MDVIMVGPLRLSSQNGLDHGCHHGLAIDALFAEQIGPCSWNVQYTAGPKVLDMS